MAESSMSAQLHAPEDAAALVAALGGQDVISKFAEQSKQLGIIVTRNGGTHEQCQDVIYKGLGVKNLLAQAERFKARFDNLCASFVTLLRARGYDVEFQAVPVKSFDSADAKVRVDYHGDASRLTDCVRGTMYIKGAIGASTIQDAYGVLDTMIRATKELADARAIFTKFKDRYQKPAGSYRDWLLLIQISGFCCELQVNLEAALKIKEDSQHHKYELMRMANRSLLDAAMRGEPKLVRIIIESRCCDVDCTDSNGFCALHYAARHGECEMLDALLRAGANVLQVSQQGHLAIYHAALMHQRRALELLTTAMESAKVIDVVLLPQLAKSSLQATWAFSQDFAPDLSGRLSSLTTRALSAIDDQLHAAAYAGDQHSCKLITDEYGCRHADRFQAGVGNCFPLDEAIASGSVPTVEFLVKKGARPHFAGPHSNFTEGAKAYLMRNKGEQLAALIASKCSSDIPNKSELVHCALQYHAYDCLYVLHEICAKAELEVGDTRTCALHEAAGMNSAPTVKILLDLGLPPNAPDTSQMTALHIAASGGFLEVMRTLIAAGADVDAVDERGWTPAIRAAQRGQSRALSLLHESKADLTKGHEEHWKTKICLTPAILACCNGHLHFVKCLAETCGVAETLRAALDVKDNWYCGCGPAEMYDPIVDYIKTLPG